MDKAWKDALEAEATALGLALTLQQVEQLAEHVELLEKWNGKLNLTRIASSVATRGKHVLDSLLGLGLVPPHAVTVLDLGAGGGFPGIPWLIARPGLSVTLVDSVQKKVSFLKTVLASLRLSTGRARHARVGGHPEEEGLSRADVVVSRAFTALQPFLKLARPYLAPGGSLIAYLGTREGPETAADVAGAEGFLIAELRAFQLPHGQGSRIVLRAVPRGTP